MAVGVFSAGLQGAYDRMFLYYIYRLDNIIHSERSSTIARGCHDCNFNKFIQHIDGLSEQPQLTDSMLPDIDIMAQALDASGLIGQYNVARIHPKAGDIVALYSRLSATLTSFLALVKTADQKVLLERVRFAAKRAIFIGSYDHSEALIAYLLDINPHLSIKKIDKHMPGSSLGPFSFFDQYGTEQATSFADMSARNAFVSGAYDFNQGSTFVRRSKVAFDITCLFLGPGGK
ncbi:hypothetical protein DL98DRAFT_587513 [Cadophora sp. DSE1049]|nr:hypothetical protein DL98DRAFT_587513 [Cadophora sp. DSE1049]